MRIALLVASLLVLSGCAAEPAETAGPSAQVSQQAADNSSMDAELDETAENEQEISDEAESADSEGTEESEDERSEGDESDRESEADAEAENEAQEIQSAEPAEEPEASQEPTQEPTQEQSPEPEPSPTAEETFKGYTLAEVSARDSAAECWVAIDGGVYDLTDWIRSHPGGSGAILSLCGTDGTASFSSRHGGQARPASTLDGYYLAPLID